VERTNKREEGGESGVGWIRPEIKSINIETRIKRPKY
jgi:hypothetical protein